MWKHRKVRASDIIFKRQTEKTGQNKYLAKKSKNKVVFLVESYDSIAFPSLKNSNKWKVLAMSQLKQYLQQLGYRAGWESMPQYT